MWGANADPDGDGIPNLIEMIFGTSGTVRNPSPMTAIRNPDGGMTVDYPISGSVPYDSHRIEWSPDLVNWRRDNLTSLRITTPPGQDVLRITVAAPVSGQTLFIRLHVGQ